MEEGSQLVYISLLFCKMAAYGYASTPVWGAAVCCLWIREPQAGSISTGFTSYSGRFCMPPYSQNADAAHSYIIVHANNVSDSEIAGEEKALRQYVCSATACLPYYQPPYSHLIFSNWLQLCISYWQVNYCRKISILRQVFQHQRNKQKVRQLLYSTLI